MLKWRKREREKPTANEAKPLELEHGVATHIGQRKVNADSFLAHGEKRLFAVADGVGDHSGKVASAYIVGNLAKQFSTNDPSSLYEVINAVHRRLSGSNKKQTRNQRRTTVSAMHVALNGKVHIANSGDSRIYRLRKGALEQLTTDLHPTLQAIGNHYFSLNLSTAVTDAMPGDVFLLSTDGVHGNEEINRAMHRRLEDSLRRCAAGKQSTKQTAENIVEEARKKRPYDSKTALVVKVKK